MRKNFLKYIAGVMLFGSNGIIASHIALPSDQIVLLRSVLGGILLIVLFLATGHRFTAFAHKGDLMCIAASGAAMAANWLFLFEAYQKIGVSLSIVINYCGPAIAVVASIVLFQDKLTVNKTAALISALLGAILIDGFSAKNEISITGLVCAVLAAFSCAAMIVLNKCSKKIVGTENAVLQLFFTALSVTIYMGCRGSLKLAIPAGSWPWILWLALLNTGVGCYFYFSSISALPVQTVAVCGYLEPLLAVLLSVAFLSESLRPLQIVGAALILGGAVLGECVHKHRDKVVPECD